MRRVRVEFEDGSIAFWNVERIIDCEHGRAYVESFDTPIQATVRVASVKPVSDHVIEISKERE